MYGAKLIWYGRQKAAGRKLNSREYTEALEILKKIGQGLEFLKPAANPDYQKAICFAAFLVNDSILFNF